MFVITYFLGQFLSDDLPLKHLVLKPTTKLMLIGSTDEEKVN